MLSKKYITKNLNELDTLYKNSKGALKPKFYAKLAIIEASGWIEECLDVIIRDLASNKLNQVNFNAYNNDTVKKNSGFKYDEYIRNKLLKNLIGLIHIEKLEGLLSTDADFIAMKAALTTLADERNANAHTHISGTTPGLSAPSLTIANFNKAYSGIVVLNNKLKKLKFK